MSNIIDSIQLSGTVYTLSAQTGGGGVPESTFTAYTAATDERISQDEEVTAAGLNALNEKITPTVELTQAQYDALVTAGTVAEDTYYIITDAQAVDLTQYWTSAQTQSAINQATSGKASQSDLETVSGQVANKQDLLISGTNIKTINNTSLLGSGNIDIQGGGGGKAVSGGTNISITTGETADTVSCTLPLTVGSSNNSLSLGVGNSLNNSARTFAIGDRNSIGNLSSNSLVGGMRSSINYNCADSIAFGYEANVGSKYSCSIGSNTKTSNDFEAAFGRYNASNTGSTDADKTRFSVGNGTDDNARHNAFEIRQNGDIYLSSGGTDIKLQDHLGGGGSITVDTALSSTSENPVQNKALYDELRIVEAPTETVLQWDQHDGGQSTNYPSGCTKVMIIVDEQQMDSGGFTLIDSSYESYASFGIESLGGTITVTNYYGDYTYSISGNVVTIEYPTYTNVWQISTAYDNYWTWKAIEDGAATPLIDKVIENEEVTAAALNVLNDKFDGLKLKKLTQSAYNALSPNYDSNTLYVIVN